MTGELPPLDPSLLAILVDPVTKHPLVLVQLDGRWVLQCRATGKQYRIDPPDIPVLLADEAIG